MINKIFETNTYQSHSAGAVESSSARVVVGRTPKENRINQTSSSSDQSVKITISEEALRKAGLLKESESTGSSQSSSSESSLTSGELQELASLKSRDREVRAHEMAHVAVGGSLVRKGASFQYELGPDGVRYAVSGEVSIDTSPVRDNPAATLRKMEQVKRAALAPAEPSSQDRSVAASAAQKETAARQELQEQSAEEMLT